MKIAKCGYGTKGDGLGTTPDGYTYLVNDSVRTKDVIQVIATARDNTTKFATTAKALHVYGENTVKGKEAKQEAESKGEDGKKREITRVYTGQEVGATAPKHGAKQPAIGEQKKQSLRTLETRAGNIAQYQQTHPDAKFSQNAIETFDSYSAPFMKGGQQ